MNEDVSSTSRNWALWAHLLGLLAGYVIPFGNILAPLVIWLMKKEEDAFVARHALEAMNFQLTVLLAYIASGILILVVIGIPLLFAVFLAQVILSIMATMAASRGDEYRYPWTLRMVNG